MATRFTIDATPRLGAVICTFQVAAEIMRLRACLVAAGYVLLGAYVATEDGSWLSVQTCMAALVVALIFGAAFVYNDVEDELADSLNVPDRPIPSKRLSRQSAIWFAIALTIVALTTVAWLSSWLILVTIAYVILSALYSRRLKGTVLVGNLTVALLIGSIPIYGGIASGNVSDKLIVAALMVFLFSLAQEILCTLEDVDGDRGAGLRTTATYFGHSTSLRLYQFVAVIFVVVSLLPWHLGLVTRDFLYAVIVCTVVPTLVAALSLGPEATAHRLRLSADTMRVVWWTSVIPFVLLR